SSVTPLLKTPVELWAGKQVYKDIPLSGKQVQMPAAFAALGLTPVLKGMGLAKSGKGGDTISDKEAYALEQFLPQLGVARRLFPNEPKYQERGMTNWINYILGLQVRVNTPSEQKSELFRRKLASGQLQ